MGVLWKQTKYAASCLNWTAWSTSIIAHVKVGHNEEALSLYWRMQNLHLEPDEYIFVAVLKACASLAASTQGKMIHALAIKGGLESDIFVGNAVIDLYAKCKSLEDAHMAFIRMPKQDVVTWNVMIAGYAHHGHGQEALQFFQQMQQKGVKADRVTYICILQACLSPWQGKPIHVYIIEDGFESDIQVGNTLINMYAKSGNLKNALSLFDRSQKQNVVTWNAMISGFIEHEHGWDALAVFQQMQADSIRPNQVTFVLILKACSSILASDQGRLIHSELVRRGLESDVFVASTLIDMHAKLGSIADGSRVFDRLLKRNLVTWTAMISGYVQHGHDQQAFQLFQQMIEEGIEPNQSTFICILKACSSMTVLNQGRIIHTYIFETGFESNVCVSNTLIDMYAKCGSLEDACQVFDKLPEQNAVTWNAILAGYAQHGQGEKAFQLFQNMQEEEVEPDQATYVCILKACSSEGTLTQGKLINAYIIENGFDSDVIVCNTLIDMYAKCDSLLDAQNLFSRLSKQDVIAWNAVIGGYILEGHYQEVFQKFQKMQQEGIKPDQVTFASILKACSCTGALSTGELIHKLIIESGFASDAFVCNALIDMYGKCGSLSDAQSVFDSLSKRNATTLGAIINGYSQYGYTLESLQFSQQWQHENLELDSNTCMCILKVCSGVAALDQGKLVHSHLIERGYEIDVLVCNVIIDMYAKCGSLKDACKVFATMPRRDVVTWNAIIAGCSQHRGYNSALQYFMDMQGEGLKPNTVTFVSLLSACSHTIPVTDGCHYFNSMISYGIAPTHEHYNCMVNLLSSAGYLTEAEDLLITIPCHFNIMGWTSLLGYCKSHCNLELGRRCFDHIITVDGRNGAAYTLLSGICAYNGIWNEAERVEELRTFANAWKKPGKAFIEIGNTTVSFIVEDKSHPQIDHVYAKLHTLDAEMKAEGYIPHWNSYSIVIR